MTFSSTEQYMMYHKATAFDDFQIARQIMESTAPRQQKAKGRQVKGFNEATWEDIREKIVEEGNWWKFTATQDVIKGRNLRALLLDTGDKLLVEASPFDNIWGIGFEAEFTQLNRAHWGLNLLGKALMRVRTRIREEFEEKT